MRRNAQLACCFLVFLCTTATRPAQAQQEVYHPGETYDSLQAGQDAYWDAEAQRRALIGRQLMIEEQIILAKHLGRPAGQISAGAARVFRPDLAQGLRRSHAGGRLCLPAVRCRVLWERRSAPSPAPHHSGAPVPVFQPWPRVPSDIWGTPYYGYVRQPIGHVKIWTGRLSYIYKPIYASPPMETAQPAPSASPRAAAPLSRRPLAAPKNGPPALLRPLFRPVYRHLRQNQQFRLQVVLVLGRVPT